MSVITQSPPVPERLAARFDLERKLGEGGAAEVWRVRRDGQIFALKILHAEVARDRRMVQRLLQEGHILEELQHPNIVRVFEVGREPDCPYLLCEFVDGSSLDELILREGPIAWNRALALAQAVLSALEFAHARQILHRDVKPSNVLVDASGTPHLADFGIAKVESARGRRTTPGVIVGSPAYLAPEIVKGREATPRSDVFSTGVMIFEMLSGQLPFPDDGSSESFLYRLRNRAAKLSTVLDGVPAVLDSLLETALEIDPVNRFPSASTFQRCVQNTVVALERAGTKLSSGERRRSARQPDWERDRPPLPVSKRSDRAWPSRFPLPVMLALGGLLGLSALLAIVLVGRPSRSASPHVPATADAAANLTAAEEALLREILVLEGPGSELAGRLALVENLAPGRRAPMLYKAWRGTSREVRAAVGSRLALLSDAFAVPVLVETMAAAAIPEAEREAAAHRLVAVAAPGAEASVSPRRCPDSSVVVAQLCSILNRCVRKQELPIVVKAAIRGLAWLGDRSTACVADIARAPWNVGWVGDTAGDDPEREVRRALEAIGSVEARRELAELSKGRSGP